MAQRCGSCVSGIPGSAHPVALPVALPDSRRAWQQLTQTRASAASVGSSAYEASECTIAAAVRATCGSRSRRIGWPTISYPNAVTPRTNPHWKRRSSEYPQIHQQTTDSVLAGGDGRRPGRRHHHRTDLGRHQRCRGFHRGGGEHHRSRRHRCALGRPCRRDSTPAASVLTPPPPPGRERSGSLPHCLQLHCSSRFRYDSCDQSWSSMQHG